MVEANKLISLLRKVVKFLLVPHTDISSLFLEVFEEVSISLSAVNILDKFGLPKSDGELHFF